jgi:ketosteroid isomerase-like protein
MKKLLLPLLAVALATFASAAIDKEAAKAELIRIDWEFSKLSGEIGIVEALYRYQSEHAMLMNSGTTQRDATRAANKGLFDDRHIVHTPRFADISASGELGYTWGDWTSTALKAGPDGKKDSIGGVYINIWKKQRDGSWKLVVDGVTRLGADALEKFRAATPAK